MYSLGESFKLNNSKGIASNSSIFQGNNYRITVLSEGLVRLEYSNNGIFKDELTELVCNRVFPKIDISTKETESLLEIQTKKFILKYQKNNSFIGTKLNPSSNLKIELIGTDKSWYINHVEARNIKTLATNNSKKTILKKGLYSYDGFVSINDNTKLLTEDGNTTETNDNIDTYVFMYGTEFESCLKDYFTLTGYPPLIPRYALGNWWSKNIVYSSNSLQNLVNSFKANDIPISVILLENKWNIKPVINDKEIDSGFTFNKELFDNPKEFLDNLHNQGIRLGLRINPTNGFYNIDEYYETALQYVNKDELGCIPFNVLDSKSVDVYLKLFIHPLDNIGIDFYFVDKKEDYDNYNILKYYHLCDMARNKKRRPIVFGYADEKTPHKYSILYAGKSQVSWNSLRKLPLFNCLAMNNGVLFWSHDIGGYDQGIEEDELYIRFVQFGTFSPILRLSSDSSKYYKREPWLWDMKTFSILKEYLTLRHKLIPYLYSETYKYSTSGNLLIKPVFYKYPELYDDQWYSNEYYFGSQLFVCPIITKKDTLMNRVVHKFFIPEGIWYDFFTGKKFTGNINYVSFFKDQEYPVYAKQGAIIPLGYNDNLNDLTPPTNMEIHIFPGVSNSYVLYEDDGVSSLYKDGYYLKTQIDYNYMPNNYTVIIRSVDGKSKVVPDRRNYKFVFRNTKKAVDVVAYFNNIKVETNNYTTGQDFIVELKDINTIGQLSINCKGKDIEIDAIRLINNEIESILSDLQIKTELKEKVNKILFSDLPINKKRIEIRKLGRKGLDNKIMKLFLDLLEYVNQI